ncbi:MAG: hypothetical protein JW940_25710, partial [Polyangiaceae bacterium]|nr:hypothetical protein [Polyangiaceae bacterium]
GGSHCSGAEGELRAAGSFLTALLARNVLSIGRGATTAMARISVVCGYTVIAIIAALGGWVLWRSVPFDLASYAAWASIIVALIALVSVVRPQRWLGIPTRARAAGVFLLGATAAPAAVLWPSGIHRSSGPKHRVDDFLPQYQFAQYHEARTRAPRSRVLEAVRQVSLADMPAAVVLLRLRALASGHLSAPPVDTTPLLEVTQSSGAGFLPLDVSNGGELVLGMVGRPWVDEPPPRVRTAEQFLAFASPGHVRVAFDFRIVEEGDGVVRVSTETRILGNDPEARRVFARYWRLIYPGSAIIRRVWLDAIVARAERP